MEFSIGKFSLDSETSPGGEHYAWGRLYTNKLPVTAVQVLNNDVLPYFEAHQMKVETVLTDNGREYCGRPDHHPFELFLQLEEIEHRKTKVRRPQSNGFVERLHRTLLDEHFRIKGRERYYESISQMQDDLDEYLKHYNEERTHQGRNMNGRTPKQAFLDVQNPGQSGHQFRFKTDSHSGVKRTLIPEINGQFCTYLRNNLP